MLLHPPVKLNGNRIPPELMPVRPLTSDCIVCDPSYSRAKNVTILIVPPLSLHDLRAVILAVSIAKATLGSQGERFCEQERDDCHLYRIFANMSVVLLEHKDQHRIPEVLPPFVHVESGNVMDTLARYPFTVTLIGRCGDVTDHAAWMGLALMCLPQDHEYEPPVAGRKFDVDNEAYRIAESLYAVIRVSRVNTTAPKLPHAANLIWQLVPQIKDGVHFSSVQLIADARRAGGSASDSTRRWDNLLWGFKLVSAVRGYT